MISSASASSSREFTPSTREASCGLARGHPLARAAQAGDDVGQVDLALVVVGAHLAQDLEGQRRRQHVHAAVDLADLPLVRGGVAMLHDLHHVAVSSRTTRP